jgi:hypothetical protein
MEKQAERAASKSLKAEKINLRAENAKLSRMNQLLSELVRSLISIGLVGTLCSLPISQSPPLCFSCQLTLCRNWQATWSRLEKAVGIPVTFLLRGSGQEER